MTCMYSIYPPLQGEAFVLSSIFFGVFREVVGRQPRLRPLRHPPTDPQPWLPVWVGTVAPTVPHLVLTRTVAVFVVDAVALDAQYED